VKNENDDENEMNENKLKKSSFDTAFLIFIATVFSVGIGNKLIPIPYSFMDSTTDVVFKLYRHSTEDQN
jgi:hypothetical protein